MTPSKKDYKRNSDRIFSFFFLFECVCVGAEEIVGDVCKVMKKIKDRLSKPL